MSSLSPLFFAADIPDYNAADKNRKYTEQTEYNDQPCILCGNRQICTDRLGRNCDHLYIKICKTVQCITKQFQVHTIYNRIDI